MKPYVLGAIFARGGSKGVPCKNLRMLAGKPLIAHSIETVLACDLIDRLIVSTDDLEIANVARQYGAEVPFMRPAELATDDAPEWLAWQHALRAIDGADGAQPMDVFVCVPTTSPLRSVLDVTQCIQTLLDGDSDLVLTVRPAERNPYFNMVVLDQQGYAHLVIPPNQTVHQRQGAPTVFDITTVAYAARPQFVLNAKGMFDGKVRTLLVPPERALDIDTELDLKVAEALLAHSLSSANSK